MQRLLYLLSLQCSFTMKCVHRISWRQDTPTYTSRMYTRCFAPCLRSQHSRPSMSGEMDGVCYGILRAAAFVAESGHHTLVHALAYDIAYRA